MKLFTLIKNLLLLDVEDDRILADQMISSYLTNY